MDSYYTLMGIEPNASQEKIEQAYIRQRTLYDPDRVTHIDEEMRQLAAQRTRELEQAYQVLSDPLQRRWYDERIGNQAISKQEDATGNAREYWYAAGGVIVGLVLMTLAWIWAGRNAPNVPSAPEVNRPAPDFVLASPNGGEIRLNDYRGKIILVNFWGTWCDPCVRETPALQAAYEKLREQGFVIIGVNLFKDEKVQGRDVDDIRKFMKQHSITYPIALDAEGKVTDSYGIYPIPTSFFIDDQGHIRYILPRELTTQEIVVWFEKLKQETKVLQQK